MAIAPTIIDLSRLPAPNAIEPLNFEALLESFKTRFLAFWAEARILNPDLPDYNVQLLESDTAAIVGEAWSYLRLLDRARVNDVYRALLAPFSTGSNLDAIAASRNLSRLTIIPATASDPAVMEGDAALFRRYLLSFDKPSAGSVSRYLWEAWTVWPQSEDKLLGLWDAKVNGYEIHGRRGDSDIVIIGPNGRLPTAEEWELVRSAVTAAPVKPEAVSVSVVDAKRAEYAVSLVIEVPAAGPSPDVVKAEAEQRVWAAAIERTLIDGEISEDLLSGAAYGPNVLTVMDLSPVVIKPDPYTIPVMTSLSITVELRT